MSATRGWRLDGGRALLDVQARQLLVGGAPVKVGGRAFDLLTLLVERRAGVVSKSDLLDRVWPGLVVEENNLQVHVLSLRKLLGAHAIATVSGRGYRFTASAEALADGPPPAAATDSASALDGGSGARPAEPTGIAGRADPMAPGPTARVAPVALIGAAGLGVLEGPASPAALIGRDALVAGISARLSDPIHRLVTLTGPGGSGKTRIALRVAGQLAPAFAGGSCAVMLAPVPDAAGCMAAVASALGLPDSAEASVEQRVHDALAERATLLLLDNLEHLPDAVAQVGALLRACPRLKILATSRVLLHLTGEHEVRIPPLALPQGEGAAQWAASPALQLFAARAAAVGRPLRDSAEDHRAAAQICRRLDGLPLAIELAAARLRTLTPVALAARLQQSLPLLIGGAADAPQRQQTLRHTIAWSHDRLASDVQRLFRRVGVFSGGWSLAAAEAIDDDPSSVIDRLEVLLDHNLVQRIDDGDSEARYAMLQTIREFALERLLAAGEEAALRDRHADHCIALSAAGQLQLTSPARAQGLTTLRPEMNNFRAALAWLLRERKDAARGMALAASLAWLWSFEGHYREGLRWIDEARALPGVDASGRGAAELLSGAARLAWYLGDMPQAHDRGTASVALWRNLGDARGLGLALLNLGVPALFVQGRDAASAVMDEAAQAFERAGDSWGHALAAVYRGVVLAVFAGTEDAALPLLQDGMARCRAIGDEWAASICSGYIGQVALRRGDVGLARVHMARVLGQAQETGDRFRIGLWSELMADLELQAGCFYAAVRLAADAAVLTFEQGLLAEVPQVLRLLARALVGLSQHADAALLFGAGERDDAGPPPVARGAPAEIAAAVAACRLALGDAAFERALAEGRALSLAQAVEGATHLAAAAAPSAPA